MTFIQFIDAHFTAFLLAVVVVNGMWCVTRVLQTLAVSNASR